MDPANSTFLLLMASFAALIAFEVHLLLISLAFYLDSFSSSWSKMMDAYEVKESLSSDQLNKLEEMQWQEMPESLKLFAYDYCIKNGFCFTGTSC